MLLDDLTGAIELLRERIQSHGDALRENETRTRLALVDPLLQASGWDVSDPAVVTPEFKVTGGWADYALLRSDGPPAATVEAKKLGEPLASHRIQMLNYANASGIDFAALTDGDHWELYDVFRRGTLEERRILDVSIARDPVHEVALKLLLLWRTNLTSGEPVHAAESIAIEASAPKATTTEVEQRSTPRSESPDWVSLFGYEKTGHSGSGRKPTAIRFWDGSVRSVERWVEVLTVTVEKLYAEKMLTEGDTPVLSKNASHHLVNTEPVHPTGEEFSRARSIDGTPLFVFVHGDSNTLRARTRRLLRLHGPRSPEVHLQVQQ
ncbi:MAG: hypothetical protein OXG13_07965 [Gemmatimonadaceae bacterium]|nr:hypothetical protein [Gemmatimonadaceae bacterium]